MLNHFHWWDSHYFRISPYWKHWFLPYSVIPNFSQCFLQPLVPVLLLEAYRTSLISLPHGNPSSFGSYLALPPQTFFLLIWPSLVLSMASCIVGLWPFYYTGCSSSLYPLKIWSQHWIHYFPYGLVNIKEWTKFLHHY